ncbi:MAG: transcription-repair coupling factor [Coriobacteriaceae bacterium]|nr:transcription-repair coupling factor [Coriobacteriaceae bacterium]
MLIDELQHTLLDAEVLAPFSDKLDAGEDASVGLASSARPFLVASLFARTQRPLFVIVSGEETAERFARAVSAYLGRERVLLFPERRDLPWQETPPDLGIVGARTQALGRLAAGDPIVVIASARSLLLRTAPSSSKPFAPVTLQVGSQAHDTATGADLEYEELSAALIARGYKNCDELDGPGTFSIHGDCVEIYGAGAASPIRADFFGDEIDGLRTVMASTGQSIGDLQQARIWPAREFALSKRGVERLQARLEDRALSDQLVANHVQMLAAGISFAGMERYLPDLYAQLETPIAHAAPDTLVVAVEPRSLIDDATRRYDELTAAGREAGLSPAQIEALFCPPSQLDFGTQQRVSILSIMRAGGMVDVDLAVKRPEVVGREERLLNTIRNSLAGKMTTCFAVPDRHARDDMRLVFSDAAIPFAEVLDSDDATLDRAVLNLIDIEVPAGFILPDVGLSLISINDLTRSNSQTASHKPVDITEVTFPYQPGDYVVHASHGIARFSQIVRRDIGGVERDYLLLEYAEDDKLYVPVEQIGRITRYVGPDGAEPRLTRLNSADWSRATTRARKSAKKLAFDLVDLYARRSTVKGFSYADDDMMQEEMERIFPYEETPDQLAAIADVKADMESERPMDRLICGDVGFGKTEVALRAAFKAVSNGRQVMVLCPTTILAQQHYATFSDRFEPFGVHVEVLSRFRSPKQQQEALEGLADGTVDVLVGTHRLLSRDVNPKNLGLVIIDEEQRFGVQHKEQLKNLREHIDVLTLSATPIPRTLQMSLSGVRDMSLISTPPEHRRAVQVHVGEWDADIVSGAIRREMERGGQVYYVSNRVRTIDDAVARVLEAAPEARIGVAHGQMGEAELEEVMERLSAGDIDVLVATTIVENGLDNPHTNTLIIEDSQRLGLAQLYQLKGRVGRSTSQAYAYFLFPKEEALTQDAIDRLEAIGEFTDLGSGMKIAMRDLEIRGAGTLLGADQSGNMSAVGFDLFASMIAEAVANARGSETIAHPDTVVDLPCDCHIPEGYMPAADERVAFYRRIAAAQTEDEVDVIAEQMESLYGEVPEPTANLFDLARIKALAADCGVENVSQTAGKLLLSPVSREFKRLVDTDVQAHDVMLRERVVYTERRQRCSRALQPEDAVIQVALTVLRELARVAEENR